ncbi:hypothetical protein ACIPUD_10940 [Bradyrhizobium sp. CAR08]
MRHAIARWLSPELANEAERYYWLRGEISYNARWLAEFPFVSRTLDRILDCEVDHFRAAYVPAVCTEPADISAYRELLRREAVSTRPITLSP